MSKALTILQSAGNVSEAAEVTGFRVVYRGVEVMVQLLDHGSDAGASRYSVASFATEKGLNNQGGDGADWRLQGPVNTLKKALALIDWSRFDVRIADQRVYRSKLQTQPGASGPTRISERARRVGRENPMAGGLPLVEVFDIETGRQLYLGPEEGFNEQFELIES